MALLSNDLPDDFLARIVITASQIESDYYRGHIFRAIAPRLRFKSVLFQDVLEALPIKHYPEARAMTLLALAKVTPESDRALILDDALEAARAVAQIETRAELLLEASAALSQPNRDIVLAEAKNLAGGHPALIQRISRAEFAFLNGTLRLTRAKSRLTEIQAMLSSKERMEALDDLVDQLPDAALAKALQILWTCAEQGTSLTLLQIGVSRWDAMCAAGDISSIDALSGTLSAYGETPRPQFLAALEVLAPVIHEVGGEAAVIAAAEAVLEAGEWWP
jgi:hypothetical protein